MTCNSGPENNSLSVCTVLIKIGSFCFQVSSTITSSSTRSKYGGLCCIRKRVFDQRFFGISLCRGHNHASQELAAPWSLVRYPHRRHSTCSNKHKECVLVKSMSKGNEELLHASVIFSMSLCSILGPEINGIYHVQKRKGHSPEFTQYQFINTIGRSIVKTTQTVKRDTLSV